MEDRNTSSGDGRYIVTTKQGFVDTEIVDKYKEAHYKALPDPPSQSPMINSMAPNQTQEYFAIATQHGFEIL